MSSMSESVPMSRTWGETARIYLDVTRPRVMALVLFTGLPALALGTAAWPSLTETFWVLLGTAMAGGACSVPGAPHSSLPWAPLALFGLAVALIARRSRS